MSIIESTKSNALFLAAILIAGTFADISPSFIIKRANVQSELYPYNYGTDTGYSS